MIANGIRAVAEQLIVTSFVRIADQSDGGLGGNFDASARYADRMDSFWFAKNYRPIGLNQSFQRKRLIIKPIGR